MKKIFFSICICFFSIANTSQASGISVGGTRFVYEENKREIDIPIFNSDKEKPFLIQSWVSPFGGEGKHHLLPYHHYFVLSQIQMVQLEFLI
ncbi:molecular chaperone [Providencia hangzhouensis]|uniref:fimbrial biogenesis chaperone n=1 Tax=Providencia hangzhouensis TaxID=3031799 RepID=UPI0034DCD73E